MMRKILFVVGMIAALPSFAQDAGHGYRHSIFDGSNMIVRPRAGGEEEKAVLKANFPDWMFFVDKVNGNVADMYGRSFFVTGANNKARAEALISQKLKNAGIIPAEWVVTRDASTPKAAYVDYKQYIDGHEVLFSKLSFRFSPDGKITRIKKNAFKNPGITNIAISQQDALQSQNVLSEVNATSVTSATADANWLWFPVPTETGYELHPTWVVNTQGMGKNNTPFSLVSYIDATNGELLYRMDKVSSDIDIQVLGSVYKYNTSLPESLEPLPHLDVEVNAIALQTNDTGLFTTTDAVANTTLYLQGNWSTVYDMGANTVSVSDVFTQSGTYTLPATGPINKRMINAYYHVNVVHDFLKQKLPAFTGLDFSLRTNVDLSGGSCNAFYSGNTINFWAAGGGCNSFAEISDIVYHEYGHAIAENFYDAHGAGRMFNGGLNEGNSDVWAFSITKDSILGRNTNATGGLIRRYDINPKVFPMDIQGEEHADGEIIAGAWYDVGKNLNDFDVMSNIFTATYFDVPDGPDGFEGMVYHDVLVSALLADDDDNDFSNGTPHFEEIARAFAKHGIYLNADAILEHTEIAHQPANTPIQVTARLKLSNPDFFQGLKLIYRNRSSSWDTVAMVDNGGFNFTGQIPAQPMSSLMDYFFVVYDFMQIPTNTFPWGFSTESGRSSQVTIPYQFAVGVHPVISETFDNDIDTTQWQIGLATDRATAGKWTHAKPVQSSYSSNRFGRFISQTGKDHTTGTGKCIVTGNTATINNYAFNSNSDVDNGATTLVTPTYDLTGFVYPIIEYNRWFANDRGGSERRGDLWRVDLINESTSAQIEATRQTDTTWRRRVFAVYQYLTHGKGVKLRFVASDNGDDSNVEAAIDDFFIYDGVPQNVQNIPQVKAEIFPNPANQEVRVKFSKTVKGSIAVSDLAGRNVLHMDIDGSNLSYTLNTASLTPGQYMITIRTDNKTYQTKKLVITH